MNNEIKEILKPSNDVVFKRLFGKVGNERITKDFLEAVLDIEIDCVELGKDAQLLPSKIHEKLGVLDVKASLQNGTLIDIEMQNINHGDIENEQHII